jgi:CoA:oxalate CoA-transferase
MIVTTDVPGIGHVSMAGNPIKMPGFDDPSTRAPAPDLDADRDRIMKELAEG